MPDTKTLPVAASRPIAPTTPVQPTILATPIIKKAFGRKHPGILLITRQQIFMYIESVVNIVSCTFTPDTVRDLDVVNEDLLQKKIAELISQQQLPPASFFVVLSNQTLFSKQVTATDISQKKVEEEKFLHTIPFEIPSVRNITMGSNTYTVVANEQFFSAFDDAFSKEGSEFLLVLPEFLFAKDLNLAQGLSVPSAQILLKKMTEFKAYSFVKRSLPDSTSGGSEAGNAKFTLQVSGGKSNRLFIIVGVLVMLIGVLIAAFLFIQQNKPTPTPSAPAAIQAVDPTVVPTEVPSLEATTPTTASAELASPSAPFAQ